MQHPWAHQNTEELYSLLGESSVDNTGVVTTEKFSIAEKSTDLASATLVAAIFPRHVATFFFLLFPTMWPTVPPSPSMFAQAEVDRVTAATAHMRAHVHHDTPVA
jgi:hypothetical protein